MKSAKLCYNNTMAKKIGLITLIMFFAVGIAGGALFVITYYTSESYLALNGAEEMTVGLHGLYDDPGVDAVLHGKDATKKVRVEGKVNTNVPGRYTLDYYAGNFTVQRTVTVLSKMVPELKLTGGPVRMKLGDEYSEPGYTAVDEDDADLTSAVKVSPLDQKRAGRQTLVYTVSDSKGNTTKLTRKVTITPNTEYETSGLPICMFHYVYDENDIPAKVNGNYISKEDLAEELAFLKEEKFYFPTWNEVRDYVDGKLLLPDKSIVLTFDDGAYSFLDNGIPVLEQYRTPATSFMITSKKGRKKVRKYQSRYVTYQSHSHDMHKSGGKVGHGGIFTAITPEAGLADLKKSIRIVGSSDAFAYPFGDINENARAIVERAGFLCAVTTQPGRAKPGDDPLLLPRQRMARNQSLEVFRNMVMPYEPTTFDQGSGGSDQSSGTDSTQTTGGDSAQSSGTDSTQTTGGAEQPSAEGFDKGSE